MRAADHLVSVLHEAGVDTIFSLSGNQIMPVFDAAIESPVTMVHARHESGAVYMADGYARSTNNIGVALVTAGPGFTNAIGALFAVRETQSPLLLLSGDSPVSADGMMPFQKLDQAPIIDSFVKASWRCTNSSRLANMLTQGISLAKSGCPGIVHIALPEDVLSGTAGKMPAITQSQFMPDSKPLGNADLPSVLSTLHDAEKPLIIAGPSLHPSYAPGVLEQLAKAVCIPAISMQSPRGIDDPALGNLKSILRQADTLILIDKDIDFTLQDGDSKTIAAQQVILIATKPQSIAHAHGTLAGRLKWGCLADPLAAASTLSKTNVKGNQTWFNKVMRTVAKRKRPPVSKTGQLTAHDLCSATLEASHDHDPIFVIDGGESGQWASSIFPSERCIYNGMSGAIGGAIPQAIGVAKGNLGRRVIAVMGDGSAGFYLSEIDTARRLDLPITFIIANDLRWGAEVEIQKKLYGASRTDGCLLDEDTRYDVVAKGFGANGYQVANKVALETALKKSFRSRKKPSLINAMIEGIPAPKF